MVFNEENGLYNDFAGSQWPPKKNEKGQLQEPIEWRDDLKCGKQYPSLLNLPARCNQPTVGDPSIDNARCCKNGQCVIDDYCGCTGCVSDIAIDQDPSIKKFPQFSRHIGIVNFFPVMFGLVSNTTRLSNSIDSLSDPNQMFGFGGLRSLGAQDLYYNVGLNYWRSPVWINVNFMTLGGLFQFYIGDSQQYPVALKTKGRTLYNSARSNLIRSVYTTWMNTHFFYENFNDNTGAPQFGHPFNGWTSLILLVIAEKYGI